MGPVSKAIRVAYGELDGHMDNTITDLNTLKNLGLNTKARMAPKMLECYWYLPLRELLCEVEEETEKEDESEGQESEEESDEGEEE
ncbi:hypothetical protein IFM89_012472 [Coptis chinensis]|uniref:Uncharacterized protein n=1 Tax=Coptis chinensis TaxID=261450 RepID=A0A835I2R9_9MAGN|nr:hypothetical protein IFM89_012472 [Coptis chinensis]